MLSAERPRETSVRMADDPPGGDGKRYAVREDLTGKYQQRRLSAQVDTITLHKGSFAPIGPGTVPIETVKVIRPNHVSGLSRINVLQSRKRCTGQQKGSPFCVFPTI